MEQREPATGIPRVPREVTIRTRRRRLARLLRDAGSPDAASEATWPAIRWSAPALERKLNVVGASDTPDFVRALTAAELASVDGDRVAALRHLRNAIGGQAGQARDEDFVFENLVSTAMAAQQFEFARAVIATRFASGWAPRLSLSTERTPPLAAVARWIVEPGTPSEFRFNRAIFERDGVRLIFLFWVRWLPLFECYVSGGGERGAIDVSLNDAGIRPGLAASDYRPGYVLVPDPLFMNSVGYYWVRRAFEENPVPWRRRIPRALWRGGTAGRHGGDWRELQRVRLCTIANAASDALFDVGFSGVTQAIPGAGEPELAAAGLMKPYLHSTEWIRYKYQIDIDGNTSSWPGLFQRLLTGSPVLKVESERGYRQWYYDRLLPMKNYIPVAADMSDLVEKVDWLRANDAKAREIGQRGRELAYALDYEGELERARNAIDDGIRGTGPKA